MQTGGSVFRILLVLALLAQQQQQPPTFRGGINLITLDITATGPDGWPVRDLKQDELTLVVNGRERAIKSFELMEVAPRVASAKKPAADASAPKNIETPASNVTTPGRSVFFVILHEHICQGNERPAIDGAQAFIDQLQPRDRVAVITMPMGRIEVDLTADHAKAKARLGKIVGHAQEATGSPTTSETRALMDFVRSLAPLDGAKTIVLISEGLNAAESGIFTPQDLAGIVPLPGLLPTAEQSGALDLASASSTIAQTGGLRGAAAAARAQFYVIRPNTVFGCGGMRDPASRSTNLIKQEEEDNRRNQQTMSQESALATVASVTGGQYFSLSAKATGAFDRILRETSAYYSIAFEAEPQDLAGQFGKIQVRTSRPGVNVRGRLTLPKQPAATAAANASAREMSTTAGTYREVPLWAAAFPARGANGQFKTPIVLDSVDRSWKEASFTLTDSAGKVIAHWPADLPAARGPIVTAQSIGPGHYRLRAAVVDESGKRGSIDYEFDAKLEEAGPLTLGSLMLGTVAGASFKPQLVTPAGGNVTAYFEIYGTAPDVSVTFTLSKPGDDTPLATAAGDLTATRDADRRIATASLPLRDVPAGDYTVRATVSVGGQHVGLIASTLHVVKP
jgi:VWFA-related protein